MEERDAPTEAPEIESRAGSSLLDELRAKRAEATQDRRLELDVPGYEGLLVVRYRPTTWEEDKKISEKLERSKNPRKELYAALDTLITACDQILLRKHDGTLVPIEQEDPSQGDEPVRFDGRFAAIMGLETGSAREVVLATFKHNHRAIGVHGEELGKWLAEVNSEGDEDF